MNTCVKGLFRASDLLELVTYTILILVCGLSTASNLKAQPPLPLPKHIPGDVRPVLILGGIESASEATHREATDVSLASVNASELGDDDAQWNSPWVQKMIALIEENADLRAQLQIKAIQVKAQRRVAQLESDMRITVEQLEASQRSLHDAVVANEQLEKRVAELEHRSRLLQERLRTQSDTQVTPSLPHQQQTWASPSHDKSDTVATLRAMIDELRKSIKKFRNSKENLEEVDAEEESENEDEDEDDEDEKEEEDDEVDYDDEK